ncbi:DNA recombination protein RmuC [Nocardioides gansuensis]|uniref:DNA recombination protein RmuC n=1 Tax=Nocardioides gansuensis TaxID=2138300 RepID=A0A2T8F7E8_9ACTN|nr:DNA recombination protein RmuC [Nocardioides gansuensis]PVG81619.1 DNA recombination protein RmuC [Nocardioides gansuensis]
METQTLTALLVALAIGLGLGVLVGWLGARSRPAADATRETLVAALEQRAGDEAAVREGLERLHDQMRDLEHARATWQGQLSQQVDDMRATADTLRRETASLATALRKPQVRGRWGELHLRRAVELAGLVDRCDFTEQARLDGGALRPDLVVHLAGGKSIVVDSKVPLDAFLDAARVDPSDRDADAVRAAHLDRHARQLRTHVDSLAAKSYWRSLPESPEFVVLFVPAEAFLSAALEADGDLIDHAAGRQVVLATPTTLIALLRTVAHGWTHEALAGQAAEVQRLGRELHERLATMGGHLDRVGRSLRAAVTSYNQAVGSLEGRVLVTARRFGEMGVAHGELPSPGQVEQVPRTLGAPEFEALEVDSLAERDDEALAQQARPGAARRARGA